MNKEEIKAKEDRLKKLLDASKIIQAKDKQIAQEIRKLIKELNGTL